MKCPPPSEPAALRELRLDSVQIRIARNVLQVDKTYAGTRIPGKFRVGRFREFGAVCLVYTACIGSDVWQTTLECLLAAVLDLRITVFPSGFRIMECLVRDLRVPPCMGEYAVRRQSVFWKVVKGKCLGIKQSHHSRYFSRHMLVES